MSEQPSDPAPEEQPAKPAPPPTIYRRTYEGLVDQRIADAEAKGAFRNLPGAGKPLNLDDDSQVPEELRAGFRLLKNAGYAPAWIELQKTIREEQVQLSRWLERTNQRWAGTTEQARERARREYHDKLRDLGRLIDSFNLTAPDAAPRFPTLRIKEELKELG